MSITGPKSDSHRPILQEGKATTPESSSSSGPSRVLQAKVVPSLPVPSNGFISPRRERLAPARVEDSKRSQQADSKGVKEEAGRSETPAGAQTVTTLEGDLSKIPREHVAGANAALASLKVGDIFANPGSGTRLAPGVVLLNSTLLREIDAALRAGFSGEMSDFLSAVAALDARPDKQTASRQLIDRFIGAGARQEINISDAMVRSIMAALPLAIQREAALPPLSASATETERTEDEQARGQLYTGIFEQARLEIADVVSNQGYLSKISIALQNTLPK